MRRLSIILAAAAMALIAPIVAAPGAGAASNQSTASMESDFVSKLNSLRISKGLAPVTVDAELTAIGRRWAGKMAQAGRISHNSNYPNEVSQNWVKLGENVGTGPDVQSIHNAFVASQTHYKNMVDGAFTRIGVGVVIGPNGAIYTAHQFMRLASDDAGVAPAKPAVKAPAAAAPARKPAPAATTASTSSARKPAPATAGAGASAATRSAASQPAVVPARIALSLEQLQGRGL